MSWRNFPYWLKGGLISDTIFVVYIAIIILFVMSTVLNTFSKFLFFSFLLQLALLQELGKIFLLGFVGVKSHEIIFVPFGSGDPGVMPSAVGWILLIIFYFIVGAIIGKIVSKIKSRKISN